MFTKKFALTAILTLIVSSIGHISPIFASNNSNVHEKNDHIHHPEESRLAASVTADIPSSRESMIMGRHNLGSDRQVNVAKQPEPSSTTRDYNEDYSESMVISPVPVTKAEAKMAEVCDIPALEGLSGSDLVAAVKNTPRDNCINGLFSLTVTSTLKIFSESNMLSIANAMNADARSYDGTNSQRMLQLIIYLRAGYFMQETYPKNVPPYSKTVTDAVISAFRSFAASPNLLVISEANGQILDEFLTLPNNANIARIALPTFTKVLNSYNALTYNPVRKMTAAVNSVFIGLDRAIKESGFADAINSDPAIIDAVHNFALKNLALAGSDFNYFFINSGRAMGQFLGNPPGRARTLAQNRLIESLKVIKLAGNTAAIWANIAAQVDRTDKDNCAVYDMCNSAERISAMFLSISHTCSPTLRIRAQSMSRQELTDTCNILAGQEAFFHDQLKTRRTPVIGDLNNSLEVNVFNSERDYENFGTPIFNIDTNNGGLYLEGNPSDANNQARFIAYEDTRVLPQFLILNLNHEYVHYLDGRFNMADQLNEYLENNTEWWFEGLAEYISLTYRGVPSARAARVAADSSVQLDQLYKITYNSSIDNIYGGGYLAVRFMFEKRPAQTAFIIDSFRTNKYPDYKSLITDIGIRNNSDFNLFRQCFINPSAPSCATDNSLLLNGVTKTGLSAAQDAVLTYYIDVPAGAKNLKVTLATGSGDPDLYVRASERPTLSVYDCRPFLGSGSNETCTVAAPKAGRYYINLVGYREFSGASLTASYDTNSPPPPPATITECTNPRTDQLDRNCARSNLSGRKGDYKSFFILVPAGVPKITFRSSGGTGNTDMYYNATAFATIINASLSSKGPSNSETIVVNNPPAGYIHVSIFGETPYENVRVTAEY